MRLDALLVLLLAWSREYLHEKENWKVFKDDLFNSFCGWFDKQNAKQEFFSLLRHFSKKRGFLRKKVKTGRGKMVPVSNFFLKFQGSIRRRCKTTQIPGKIVSKS